MEDTLNYMVMGYAFAFVILSLTVGSLWWRYRNLLEDEKALETMEAELNQAAPVRSSETAKAKA